MHLSKMKKVALAASVAAFALVSTLALGACASSAASGDQDAADTAASSNAVFEAYSFSSQEQLIADTSYLADELYVNPHDNHFGQLACTRCHAAGENGENILWCTSCHDGMEVPEGWEICPKVPSDA